MGWLLVESRDLSRMDLYEHYAKDLLRDPFYLRLGAKAALGVGQPGSMGRILFLRGFAIGWLTTGEVLAGVQFGLSLLVWGVFLRTVLVWHITWSVNSVTHMWGYRNYDTDENSKNNVFVGLLVQRRGLAQ